MICKKTDLELPDFACEKCNKKCDLALNSRYNKGGAYKKVGYKNTSKVPAREIARMNIELTAGRPPYKMPTFEPKVKVPLGLGDLLYGKEPVFG